MNAALRPGVPAATFTAFAAVMSGAVLGGALPRPIIVVVIGVFALYFAFFFPQYVAVGVAATPFAVAAVGSVTYGWGVTALGAAVVLSKVHTLGRVRAAAAFALVVLAIFITGNAFFIQQQHSASTLYDVMAYLTGIVIALCYLVLRPPSWTIFAVAALTGLWHARGIIRDNPYDLDRTASWFGLNANGGAAAAALGVVAILALLMSVPRHWRLPSIIVGLPAVLACLRAMQMTGSRGSFVAIALAVAVAVVPIVRGNPALGMPFGLLGLGVAFLFFQRDRVDALLGRTQSGFSFSDNARAAGLKAAVNQIPHDAFFGVGPGQIGEVVFQKGLTAYPLTPHNAYIAVAAESGLFVLVGLVALTLTAAVRATGSAALAARPVLAFYGALGFFLQWVPDPRLAACFWVALGAALGSLEPEHSDG